MQKNCSMSFSYNYNFDTDVTININVLSLLIGLHLFKKTKKKPLSNKLLL